MRAIIVAIAPSIIAVIAWSPVLLGQLQVAKPYTWILPPSLSDLSKHFIPVERDALDLNLRSGLLYNRLFRSGKQQARHGISKRDQ